METAAIAAVSARRMRGPRLIGFHPWLAKRVSSSGVHPPSGPIANRILTRTAALGICVPGCITEGVVQVVVRSLSRLSVEAVQASRFLLDQASLSCSGSRISILRCLIGAIAVRGFAGDVAAHRSYSRRGGLSPEMLLGAARNHRDNSFDTKFGGFLNRPLETIELEDGEQECDWQRRVGVRFSSPRANPVIIKSEISTMEPRRTRSPATMSKSIPVCARARRAEVRRQWSLRSSCQVVSSQLSAIHRRRRRRSSTSSWPNTRWLQGPYEHWRS